LDQTSFHGHGGDDGDKNGGDNSNDGLPRALLTDREYHSLICGACVGEHELKEILRPYVGGEGTMVVGRTRQRMRRVRRYGEGEEEEEEEEDEVGVWDAWGKWRSEGRPVEEEVDSEDEDEDEEERETEDRPHMDVNVDVDAIPKSPMTAGSSDAGHPAVVGAKRRRNSDAQSPDTTAGTGRSTKRARLDAATVTTSNTDIDDSPHTTTASLSSTCTKPTLSSSPAFALLSEVKSNPRYLPSSSSWGATARPAAPAVGLVTSTSVSFTGIVSPTGYVEITDDYEYDHEEESLCDVFLSAGFRERWCRCAHVSSISLSSVTIFSALPAFHPVASVFRPPMLKATVPCLSCG
jgi:hypothetical protein